MSILTDWMIKSAPWLEYRVRLDLLDQTESDWQVIAAKETLISHPKIQNLLEEINNWPGDILKRHNDSNHVLHKLAFVAELGLTVNDRGIYQITHKVMDHQSSDGPFQVMVNIKPAFGGTGKDQWAWMLCDAPLILNALIRFGLREEAPVQKALHSLIGLVKENGWHCSVDRDLGKFRGPGRKGDPCPMATLMMLRSLSSFIDVEQNILQRGADTILDLWENRKEKKYYLFAMGTDFNKLKAPMIWFDILNALDTLSQFSWLLDDVRYREMTAVLKAKADEQGRFSAESIWMPWKEWEFGQKKVPSALITFYAYRILKRVYKQNLNL
jgi:hypothetical protein